VRREINLTSNMKDLHHSGLLLLLHSEPFRFLFLVPGVVKRISISHIPIHSRISKSVSSSLFGNTSLELWTLHPTFLCLHRNLKRSSCHSKHSSLLGPFSPQSACGFHYTAFCLCHPLEKAHVYYPTEQVQAGMLWRILPICQQ